MQRASGAGGPSERRGEHRRDGGALGLAPGPGGAGHGRGRPLRPDLSDPAAIAAALAATGPADVLPHNAGILPSPRSAGTTLADWCLVQAVNVETALLLTQGTLPGMGAARWGRTVNMASCAARSAGLTAGTACSMSKSALIGLTFSIAREAAADGVTANAIAYVLSPMVSEQPTDAQRAERPAQIPVGRAMALGIVHLGLGAFHRAHMAAFTQDRLDSGEANWGILGASLRSPAPRDALAPQDNLCALSLRGAEEEVRVIGAVGRVLVAPEDPGALIEAVAAPVTRVVSLTVTGKGHRLDPATGDLREGPDVAQDLAHPGSPRTVLGILAEGLARRRARGLPPPALLSCDNLAGNGRAPARVLGQFAGLRDAGLAARIEAEVACPSSMADRVVPATTAADRDRVSARLSLRDEAPVTAEPLAQWVVEDRFPQGRPGRERSGAEFVADAAPHEAMKLRLLYGARSLIAAIEG